MRDGVVDLARSNIAADSVILEVTVHDGFASPSVRLGETQLPPRAPVIAIVAPANEAKLRREEAIYLWGAVLDPGSREASDEAARWFVDECEVGTGPEHWLASLEPGKHEISLRLEGAAPATICVVVD